MEPAVGVITSRFGARVNPLTNESETHNGIDVALEEGTDVVAVAEGVVIESAEDANSGVFVQYEIPGGFTVTYAHLKKSLVKKGDIVKRGQVVAKSGNTGQSSGPHLHYTLRRYGELINPAEHIALNEQ